MRTYIRKWGNSASVRIPGAVLFAAGMSVDQSVDIREEDGRIVIGLVASPAYDLLDRMTVDTFPTDVDFGPPTGGEAW
jgi:antitoxin MazE